MTESVDRMVRHLAADLRLGFTPDELAAVGRRVQEDIATLTQLDSGHAGIDGPGRVAGVDRHFEFARDDANPFHAFITRLDAGLAGEGPLSGLRIGLKDSIAVADVPLTLGTAALAAYRPEFDATVDEAFDADDDARIGALASNAAGLFRTGGDRRRPPAR